MTFVLQKQIKRDMIGMLINRVVQCFVKGHKDMKKLGFIECYIAFFKIGLLTIGGGYTMLPIIEKEIIDHKKWVSNEDVLNSYALAQSIPGIIAVNTAVLLGYKLNKLKGAIAFCLGVISPSIIIILMLAKVYENVIGNPYIEQALNGIRIAILAMLFVTVVNLARKSIKDLWGIVLALSAFILVSFLDVSPVYVILAGVVVSILIYHRKDRSNGGHTS